MLDLWNVQLVAKDPQRKYLRGFYEDCKVNVENETVSEWKQSNTVCCVHSILGFSKDLKLSLNWTLLHWSSLKLLNLVHDVLFCMLIILHTKFIYQLPAMTMENIIE